MNYDSRAFLAWRMNWFSSIVSYESRIFFWEKDNKVVVSASAPQLESIVGANNVISGVENLPPLLKQKIANAIAPNTQIDCVVYPNTQAELAEIIAMARRQGWGVLPYGSGSKLSWGGLVKNVNIAISTERLNRLIAHAAGDMTVTAEAGMKFSQLQQILAPANQFLALDPAYPDSATLGGIVATADSGSLRQRYGGVRDQLIGFSFIRSDGLIAKAGGQVVKNVAGYDLMKLFTGSYGTLGVICQVTFRVYPLPEASKTVLLTGKAEALASAAKTLLASALTPTAIDLLSTQLTQALAATSGMGLLTRFQSIPESVSQQSERLSEIGKKLELQSHIYSDTEDSALWQRLRELMQPAAEKNTIFAKIGVKPSAAVATLKQFEDNVSDSGFLGKIHALSGLGYLRFDSENAVERISKLRELLSVNSGFLTVLEAPITIKQQIDVWGYNGNALDLMKKIKQKFDPENIFSSNRFVGGI